MTSQQPIHLRHASQNIAHHPNISDIEESSQAVDISLTDVVSESSTSMHTINSSGRRVSLLNDEPSARKYIVPGFHTSEEREARNEAIHIAHSTSYNSQSSPPTTPDLLRSDSYDSRTTLDPASPLTPSSMEFGCQTSYTSAYPDPTQYEQRPYSNYPPKITPQSSSIAVRPPRFPDRSSSSFDEEQNPSDRSVAGKRYPCRFKDSHGCDKTFTTSGHASRHSKIHTAEKCVQCSFQGCHKKFTRADNMKQHLETHYKEHSRGSASSHKSSSSSVNKLTVSAGVNKLGSKISRPPSRTGRPKSYPIDATATYVHYAASTESGPSPGGSPVGSYESLDMGGFRRDLPTGLDALADAVEYQSRN